MGHDPPVACQDRRVHPSFTKRKSIGDANQVREVVDLNERKINGQLASSAIAGVTRHSHRKHVRITSLGVGEQLFFRGCG